MQRLAIFLLLVPIALFALPYAILAFGLWLGPPLLLVAALVLARMYSSLRESA